MRAVHFLNAPMFDDTTSYALLKILEHNPGLSQRDFARSLGVSLGKVDFRLDALVEQGWLKVKDFRNREKSGLCLSVDSARGRRKCAHHGAIPQNENAGIPAAAHGNRSIETGSRTNRLARVCP